MKEKLMLDADLFTFNKTETPIVKSNKKVEEIVKTKTKNSSNSLISKNIHGIEKKSDYSHVRLRTGIYLGSCSPHVQDVILYNDNLPYIKEVNWVPALYTALREIIDNSLDELIGHKHGSCVHVTYDPNNMILSVSDDGRGIPFDWDEHHKIHLATMVLTEPRAGRNFGERGEVAGTNGIGASAVSITSEWVELEIKRDNKKFIQTFRQGNEVFEGLQISKAEIVDHKSNKTGTSYKFKPSSEVFKHMILPEDFVRSRIVELAIVNPTIKFIYNDQPIKVKSHPELTLFPEKNFISFNINEEEFKSRFWLVPNFVQSGDHYHSIVNNIPAFSGGTHIDQFKRLFFSNLLTALEKESKRRKLAPNRSDVMEGILLYNITNMKAPDFDAQSKSRLINESVTQIMKKFFENEDFYKDIIKKNKLWIDEIYKRCAERTEKKDAGDIAKLSRKVLRNKVPGLMDATGSKRQQCILFLAEGDSAVSGLATVRNPDIHGGLGLRGKVLNVNGENPKKILDNKCLVEIMNSVGLSIGQKANRSSLRYGKIYLATDSDPDGSNIAALLVNFFHSYWPELFNEIEEPFIYIFQTPFVIAEKGKQRKYWYSHNYDDFKPEEWTGWAITRAKGLGTLTEEDWAFSLANPVAIPIIDDNTMQESLDLIFAGNRSDDRKNWMGL